jgi:hypothetical protein
MASELSFLFRREEMQKLMEAGTDFIVVKASLQEAILQDGKKAGVMNVMAEAVNKGNSEPVAKVDGCPIPPCRFD